MALHYKCGIRSSVKKTLRGSVFSGDRRILQSTQEQVCANYFAKSKTNPARKMPEPTSYIVAFIFICGIRSSARETQDHTKHAETYACFFTFLLDLFFFSWYPWIK
jgi:hypothetical protein